MVSKLVVPQLGSKNHSTRDNIISLLSRKWPLSAKEIHFSLIREFGFNGSYQATHKIIRQLLEENVLMKKGKNYELNQDWISGLKKFSNELEDSYSKNSKKYLINPEFKGTVKWFFDDYSVFCVEMAKLFASTVLVGSAPNGGIGLLRHTYWPFNFKFIDFNTLVTMAQNIGRAYITVQFDAPFDRWVCKQYKSAGLTRIKLGVKELNLKEDLIIHGDSIVQIGFSEDSKQTIDKIYEQNSHLGDMFKEFVRQNVNKHKVEIHVSITKNPELAHTMRNQLIDKFFGDEK